jgi:hypothetical protein
MKGKLKQSLLPEDLRVLVDVIQLNRQDSRFVNNVTYLGVTFKMEDDMVTPYRKDCSPGLVHVHLFSIQK